MYRNLVVALLVVSGVAAATHEAADSDRVLVVRNRSSTVSCAVADDYANRRGIRQVLDIVCVDASTSFRNENLAYADYVAAIEAPVKAYLSAHPGIDYIVLTKGIPIRLNGAPLGIGLPGHQALDSALAALGYDQAADAVPVDVVDPHYGPNYRAKAWANRFWNSGIPFSHAKVGGYLVTRLDGYTQADAIALTTRSIAAGKALATRKTPLGPVLLDICPAYGFTDKAKQPYSIRSSGKTPIAITGESRFGEYNSDMQLAGDILRGRSIPFRIEDTELFVGAADLMGYASWGSNDRKYDAVAYHSLGFAPGAIADTAVSTSGRTFLPTQGGQSMICDLIAQGVSGVKGYTDEPLLQAIASPSIMFDRYTRGWTLADSLYAASALVGWQDIVIGDPLCRAYPLQSGSSSQPGRTP